METVRILFVCLGNICRSPTAEAVFREIAAREAPDMPLEIDSAGTAGFHIGEPPDARAQLAARRRGYNMSALRARVVGPDDFEHYHLILAMDRSNLATLRRRAGVAAQDRVKLFLEFAPGVDTQEVPDPYYGGENGFEEVLDLVEAASLGLLRYLREQARAA